jgi:thiol-disulfide isomerase/thioredoxin
LPHLQRFQKEFKEKGFVVFSIGNLINKKAAEDYVVDQGLKGEDPAFQVLIDGWGVYKDYGGKGAPNTFVIDRKGQVRFIHRAYSDGVERTIRREIETLFAESS